MKIAWVVLFMVSALLTLLDGYYVNLGFELYIEHGSLVLTVVQTILLFLFSGFMGSFLAHGTNEKFFFFFIISVAIWIACFVGNSLATYKAFESMSKDGDKGAITVVLMFICTLCPTFCGYVFFLVIDEENIFGTNIRELQRENRYLRKQLEQLQDKSNR